MWLFWLLVVALLSLSLWLLIKPLGLRQPLLSGLFLVLMPISSVSFYYYWGDSEGLQQYYTEQAKARLAEEWLQNYETPDEVIATFEAHLAENPERAQGWFLLSRLLMQQQRFAEALQAINKAVALAPEEVDYWLQSAEVAYLHNDAQFNVQVEQALARVLSLDPENPFALNLLATQAYQRKDYAQARAYWQRTLRQLPPQETDVRAKIEILLAEISQ